MSVVLVVMLALYSVELVVIWIFRGTALVGIDTDRDSGLQIDGIQIELRGGVRLVGFTVKAFQRALNGYPQI